MNCSEKVWSHKYEDYSHHFNFRVKPSLSLRLFKRILWFHYLHFKLISKINEAYWSKSRHEVQTLRKNWRKPLVYDLQRATHAHQRKTHLERRGKQIIKTEEIHSWNPSRRKNISKYARRYRHSIYALVRSGRRLQLFGFRLVGYIFIKIIESLWW